MDTLEYNSELYGDIMDSLREYFQTGYTVCGAQDPAVVYLNNNFGRKQPSLAKYSVVRVIDRFLNEWSSETLLEFSNKDITDQEYKLYEKLMAEEE